MTPLWPWMTLAALGAFHGLNPAMGWLFAVALGMQERRRGAVLAALPPLALGHAISIAIVLAAFSLALHALPPRPLALAGGGILLTFGCYRLVRRNAHPRWVGMQVGFRDLTTWSFLMSSAHGAGLMLVPVMLGLTMVVPHHAIALQALGNGSHVVALALGVHTVALLATMALVALAVYEVLGVALLRRMWVNLDLIWGVALIAAGAVTMAQVLRLS
ncbi:MAG TPA: hypothetical protein VEI06_02075 [Gemmatimonadaceae bacterium]|nr:hypothetical protein [Gemmatimonadaceae bacterium]